VLPVSFLFLIRSFACALMMDGAPGDIDPDNLGGKGNIKV